MPNSATSTILVFAQVEKLSFSGLRAVSPAVFMAWNMGLSFSFSLIHSEMPSSRSENRKGIRQPQLSHCCWSTKAPDTRPTISDRPQPPTPLAWMKRVEKDRKSAVEVKSVSVRVDLGGRGIQTK